MIGPESYYEKYLKGKSKEEILTAIREIKQEIDSLKNKIEHPDYDQGEITQPSEYTQIKCQRDYLEKAKQAYTEVGGRYLLSKSEEKAAKFDSRIDKISKLTFTIGGYSSGDRTYIIKFSGQIQAYSKLWDEEEVWPLVNEEGEALTKEEFLTGLVDLHMGEWLSDYSLIRFDYMVLDGTQWELKIEYGGIYRPVKFSGDNSYPYNFNSFTKLLGIDEIY